MTLSSIIILLIFILAFLAIAVYLFYELLREQKNTNELLKKQQQPNAATERNASFASITLPVKIQAYERLLLYMERLQPDVLVKRNFEVSESIEQFHLSLLQNIRDEFEHNLVQQLYVSETVWNLIRASREELIRQINIQVVSLPDDADTTYLAQVLVGMEVSIIDEAIKLLKAEFFAFESLAIS